MKYFLFTALFFVIFLGHAQENISYQVPPEEILELADVERAPSVIMDEEKQYMILLYRDAFKTIE